MKLNSLSARVILIAVACSLFSTLLVWVVTASTIEDQIIVRTNILLAQYTPSLDQDYSQNPDSLIQTETLLVDNYLNFGPASQAPNNEEYLSTLKSTLSLLAIISAITSALFGYLLSSSIRVRLGKLIDATQRLAKQQLPEPILVTGDDDIDILTREFNAMSYKLTAQHRRLRQSHDTVVAQAITLKKQSETDELTNLFNRRYFNEKLKTAVTESKKNNKELNLVLCDIDHFKKVNDSFSHMTGDEVLKKVASIMKDHTRSTDVVARIGGEEIAILMPNTSKHEALEVTERIRSKVENQPWSKIAIGLKITISFGVSSLKNVDTGAQLFAMADTFLYDAKNAGRNRVCGAATLIQKKLKNSYPVNQGRVR